jgi:hypothetical protein
VINLGNINAPVLNYKISKELLVINVIWNNNGTVSFFNFLSYTTIINTFFFLRAYKYALSKAREHYRTEKQDASRGIERENERKWEIWKKEEEMRKERTRTRRRSTGMPIRPIDQLIILTITLLLFNFNLFSWFFPAHYSRQNHLLFIPRIYSLSIRLNLRSKQSTIQLR